jgi:2'-hydroxyisoflavone reductase
MGLILDACLRAATNDAKLTWVPAEFLAGHKITARLPWIHAVGKEAAISDTDVERAFAAGLTTRPLLDTVRDTLAWHLSRPNEQQASLKVGLAPEQERAVLAAWYASQKK